MNLLVEAVSVESINVTMFDREPDAVPGRTHVTFRFPDGQSFDLDWTYRSEAPPAPGSRWTLSEETA